VAWYCLANHYIGCGMVCSPGNLVGQDSFLRPDGDDSSLFICNLPFCEEIDIGEIKGDALKKYNFAAGFR